MSVFRLLRHFDGSHRRANGIMTHSVLYNNKMKKEKNNKIKYAKCKLENYYIPKVRSMEMGSRGEARLGRGQCYSSILFHSMSFSGRNLYTLYIFFSSSICISTTQRNIPIHLAVLMFFRDVIRVRTIRWMRELLYFVVVVVRKWERVTLRSWAHNDISAETTSHILSSILSCWLTFSVVTELRIIHVLIHRFIATGYFFSS